MHGWKHTVISAFTFWLLLGADVNAADSYFAAEIGFNSGDFGSGITTDLSSFNFTIGTVASRYEASVALPYYQLRDDSGYSENGIGDMILRGSIEAVQKSDWNINLALAIKVPLADEEKGLGTGETDVGAFVAMNKDWQELRGFLSLGYIQTGDPAGINYNDVTLYSVGLFRKFARSGAGVSLASRTAVSDDADDPLELALSGFHILDLQYTLTASAFKGFNDGGPDYGLVVGIVRWF